MLTENHSISRRDMLRAATIAASGMSTSRLWTKPAQANEDRYAGLDSEKYLSAINIETEIVDEEIFTEGPAWDGRGNLFFTNVPMQKILKWSPKTSQLTVFREKSHSANGLYFDPQGRLLACEGGAGRVTRTDMASGKIEVLADKFREFAFAAPNDLCLDKHGRVYFTSRPGVKDPTQGNVNAVYRLDLDKPVAERVHQILAWPDVHMPNGIVISPDGATLYLIEAHPDADHHRNIMAYDLDKDGGVKNGRVLTDFYPGRSGDGMCIDSAGNLYVAAGLHATRKTSETLDTKPGIHVVSPQGQLLAYRETPVDTITNCTFGGDDLRTLYVTCGKYLVSMRTKIAGKASYRPATG